MRENPCSQMYACTCMYELFTGPSTSCPETCDQLPGLTITAQMGLLAATASVTLIAIASTIISILMGCVLCRKHAQKSGDICVVQWEQTPCRQ